MPSLQLNIYRTPFFINICYHKEDVKEEVITLRRVRRGFLSTWAFGLILKSCWVYTNYVNEWIHAIKGLLSPDPLQMFPAVKISYANCQISTQPAESQQDEP